MQTIVGIRFKKAGKIYYFNPMDLDVKKDDGVIVETARGLEYGIVVLDRREVPDPPHPYRPIERKATEDDSFVLEENKERLEEAARIFEDMTQKHGLLMKLVNIECTFDFSKIIFYFTADGRVDFRALVKDLASIFRTRIELRQIGVRDEARQLGGIGACGRPICCAAFLGDFEPVSIKMAKDQNLSLNPTKISGICGRLMCCLKYEQYAYEGMEHKRVEIKEPEQGSRVMTEEGEGKVISVNPNKRTATILLDSGKTVVLQWDDILENDNEDDIIAKVEERPAPHDFESDEIRKNNDWFNRNDKNNVCEKQDRSCCRQFSERQNMQMTRERREHREPREYRNDGRKERRGEGNNGGYGWQYND